MNDQTYPMSDHAKCVVEDVAKKHGLTFDALMRSKRSQRITPARHEAMYALRSALKPCGNYRYSLLTIARMFRLLDHTTITHGIKTHAVEKMGGVMPSEARGATVQRVLVVEEIDQPSQIAPWPSTAARKPGKWLWLEADVERAVHLLSSGYSYAQVAQAMGRTVESLRSRLRKDQITFAKTSVNDARDRRHVRACLMAGGFPVFSEQEIGIDRLGRRKMSVCLPITYPQRQPPRQVAA